MSNEIEIRNAAYQVIWDAPDEIINVWDTLPKSIKKRNSMKYKITSGPNDNACPALTIGSQDAVRNLTGHFGTEVTTDSDGRLSITVESDKPWIATYRKKERRWGMWCEPYRACESGATGDIAYTFNGLKMAVKPYKKGDIINPGDRGIDEVAHLVCPNWIKVEQVNTPQIIPKRNAIETLAGELDFFKELDSPYARTAEQCIEGFLSLPTMESFDKLNRFMNTIGELQQAPNHVRKYKLRDGVNRNDPFTDESSVLFWAIRDLLTAKETAPTEIEALWRQQIRGLAKDPKTQKDAMRGEIGQSGMATHPRETPHAAHEQAQVRSGIVRAVGRPLRRQKS